jgi:DNA-directed RNA polymerase specialized sigma24 family protein
MDEPGSVTVWISQLKGGDPEAAQELWERYFRRLVRLARTRLQSIPRRAVDDEDVALSAFASFCRGAEQGRFPQLHDRNNLWPLLLTITLRKAADVVQHHRSQRQGGGKVQGESALLGGQQTPSSVPPMEQILCREPTPEAAARMAEECQRLLDRLGDAKLQHVAILKMEGYTDKEVAAKLHCAVRTVERKVARIRGIWEKEIVS